VIQESPTQRTQSRRPHPRRRRPPRIEPSPLARPGRALRAIFRAPNALYRLRLGGLLGHRFLQVTHRGRTSGRTYRTVLEVVAYDPTHQESVVVAGFGTGSDWYRNLQAHPALEVVTGWLRYVPAQRFLSVEEGAAALAYYESRHGKLATAGLKQLFGYDGSPAGRLALAQRLPMIAFRPATAADLATTTAAGEEAPTSEEAAGGQAAGG
jgi:deazaflavin-dependent oxidoreductase (nitroreductase family)